MLSYYVLEQALTVRKMCENGVDVEATFYGLFTNGMDGFSRGRTRIPESMVQMLRR